MEILSLSLNSEVFPIISKFRKGDQKILNIYDIIYYDQSIFCYLAKLKKGKFLDDQILIMREGEKLMRKYGIIYFEILNFDARSKTYWVFIKQKMPRLAGIMLKEFKEELFLIPPIIITEKKFQIHTLIHEDRLVEFEEFLKKNELEYQWIKKKKFELDYHELDKEGLAILEAAYREGFFDNPRRVSLGQLANTLGTSKSTLTRKLRKYEGQLINYVFNNGMDRLI